MLPLYNCYNEQATHITFCYTIVTFLYLLYPVY
nr:MAG TPA: hypothetical protein [Caudoviricetes sp.]